VSGIIASIITILIIAPMSVYIILFSFCKWITKKHKWSIDLAVIGSMPFIISSVYFIFLSLWDVSLLWVIFIVMAISGIVISIILWKRDPDMEWNRIAKGFCRINFVVFHIVYAFTFFYGLIYEIFTAVIS